IGPTVAGPIRDHDEAAVHHPGHHLLRQSWLSGDPSGDAGYPDYALAGLRSGDPVDGWRSADRSHRRGDARHGDRQDVDGAWTDRHFYAGLLAGRGDESDHPEPVARYGPVLLGAEPRLQAAEPGSMAVVQRHGYPMVHIGGALWRALRARAEGEPGRGIAGGLYPHRALQGNQREPGPGAARPA